MQLFYTTDIIDNLARLSAEEARHCVQVLRKQAGDLLDLVDGNGFFYKGEIIETSKKECLVKILERRAIENQRPYLQMAIAPTKNIDRFEWFLEKATEIGVDEVIPLRCARSERKNIRPDRLEKILLSAMKQSLKARLPKLQDLTGFKEFINQEQSAQEKLIAYCNDDQLAHLKTTYKKGNSALILIGPEGDFSDEEVALAKANGFMGIGLGKSRLRTETAGVVACTVFNLINS
jgi:16S rRNA (uracil1498-N3)-methyltransferase